MSSLSAIALLIIVILSFFYLLKPSSKDNSLRLSLIVITFFLAIRYGWGNDYFSYIRIYEGLHGVGLSIDELSYYSKNNEWGWALINRIGDLSGIGFFGIVIVLSIFQNIMVYRFIKRNVTPQYYVLTLLMYVTNITFFAIGCSMMRQQVCIISYLGVFLLMQEEPKKIRNLIISIAIILLCSTIHSSNIAMLLTLPLYYIKFKGNRSPMSLVVVMSVAYLVWSYLGPKIFQNSIVISYLNQSEELSAYVDYINENTASSGNFRIGFRDIFRTGLCAFLAYKIRMMKREEQLLSLFFIISMFFEPLVRVVVMIGRYNSYFIATGMAVWPVIVKYINNKTYKTAVITLQLLFLLASMLQFFNDPLWRQGFGEYHTIFEVPWQ